MQVLFYKPQRWIVPLRLIFVLLCNGVWIVQPILFVITVLIYDNSSTSFTKGGCNDHPTFSHVDETFCQTVKECFSLCEVAYWIVGVRTPNEGDLPFECIRVFGCTFTSVVELNVFGFRPLSPSQFCLLRWRHGTLWQRCIFPCTSVNLPHTTCLNFFFSVRDFQYRHILRVLLF